MNNFLEFLQLNFTGPFPKNQDVPVQKEPVTDLEIDGEDIYQLTKSPSLLLSSIEEFRRASVTDTGKLWLLRALFIHQRLLENPSSSLFNEIVALVDAIAVSSLPKEQQESFNIEVALVYHYYKKDSLCQKYLQLAQEQIGFKFRLTGALGKRTKFQTFEVVQLVVDATPSNNSTPNITEVAPNTIDLNDDTLLESISFTDARFHQKLNPLDQCILLAYCLNVKNINPIHGLSSEEMMSYVARVLENPNSWLVHTMALLLRSRLESVKGRTVERSALQLQALVEQCQLEEPQVSERLEYFFSLLIPPIWQLERELGERFVSLGVVVSALEIFKRLHLWEDVISCHQMMEKNKEAEQVVLAQLEICPTSPKFLCILGDLRDDKTYYEQAWEVSGHRYARAMRSLAARYFKENNYELSIECYEKALSINPLFDNSWFVLGCAAMRTEKYDLAVMAFIKVVNIDFENGEAWTNLASVYIRQKKKLDAWRALKEALKLMYENIKIWQNFLYCSIDLMKIVDSITAFTRCVELSVSRSSKEKETLLDIEILDILIETVTKDLPDADGEGSAKHTKSLQTLLLYLTSTISNSPKLYKCCTTFYTATKQYKNALEHAQKAYRLVLNQPGMNLEEDKFVLCAKVTLDLVDAYMTLGSMEEVNRMGAVEIVCADYLYQARMCLKTVIGRTKDWDEHTSYTLLTDALERIKSL